VRSFSGANLLLSAMALDGPSYPHADLAVAVFPPRHRALRNSVGVTRTDGCIAAEGEVQRRSPNGSIGGHQ